MAYLSITTAQEMLSKSESSLLNTSFPTAQGPMSTATRDPDFLKVTSLPMTWATRFFKRCSSWEAKPSVSPRASKITLASIKAADQASALDKGSMKTYLAEHSTRMNSRPVNIAQPQVRSMNSSMTIELADVAKQQKRPATGRFDSIIMAEETSKITAARSAKYFAAVTVHKFTHVIERATLYEAHTTSNAKLHTAAEKTVAFSRVNWTCFVPFKSKPQAPSIPKPSASSVILLVRSSKTNNPIKVIPIYSS
mmetsp:Transcript_105754/g.188123  ORF Transcript_105754/g.188123 Transcript_105754/m.188123 type:complete len:252 (+) Transcript_105754:418-1173(+)